MKTPIELHFYNKHDEIIKTFSKSTIRWKFLKEAVVLCETDGQPGLDLIYDFVCRFYDNKFSIRTLKKYTDVGQVTAVASHIVTRVLNMMQEEGIEMPKKPKAARRKNLRRMLCRMIGSLRWRA